MTNFDGQKKGDQGAWQHVLRRCANTMDETPTFIPLTPHLGARVEGLAINRPLGVTTVEVLQQALYKYGLLLFKNVQIEEDEQIRFARYFGRISKLGAFFKDMPDVIYVSNARDDGILGDDELTFHSDKFFMQTPPKAALLYGMEIPPKGGETLFTNTAHLIRTMAPELRERLSKLTCRHIFAYRRHYGSPDAKTSSKKLAEEDLNRTEICDHPVLSRHPWSEQLFLAVNTRAPRSILGVSEDESRAIVRQLAELIERPENVYRHVWEKGDVVFWDNYLLQHARTAFDSSERRTLRRCQIAHELEPLQQ